MVGEPFEQGSECLSDSHVLCSREVLLSERCTSLVMNVSHKCFTNDNMVFKENNKKRKKYRHRIFLIKMYTPNVYLHEPSTALHLCAYSGMCTCVCVRVCGGGCVYSGMCMHLMYVCLHPCMYTCKK